MEIFIYTSKLLGSVQLDKEYYEMPKNPHCVQEKKGSKRKVYLKANVGGR